MYIHTLYVRCALDLYLYMIYKGLNYLYTHLHLCTNCNVILLQNFETVVYKLVAEFHKNLKHSKISRHISLD